MTDSAADAHPSPAPPVDPGLGQRALGGSLWATAQTIGSKVFVLGQQYLLAVLLIEEDFAPTAIAAFILAFASFGQQLGVVEILVRRHRTFDLWANTAFWLNLLAGLLGMLLVLAAAPFAAHVFQLPALLPYLVIGAIAIPLDALAVVPQAKLTHEMQFRALSIIGTLNVFATVVLTVVLAAMHFGAFSLIIPKPIVSGAQTIALFAVARLRPSLRPRLRRWKLLFRDARYFLAMNFFGTFLNNGDYLTCGFFFPKPILGSYYLAFNASTQTNQLIANNLASVLLPSFARMREPQRQIDAYARVCSLISFLGVPLCILQAICAEPLFHLLFKHKWDTALPLFAILSIGMLFVLPSGPTVTMLKAQGRYRLLMYWTIVVSTGFILAVLCGAMTRSIIGLAVGVASFYLVAGPLGCALPLAGARQKLVHILHVYLGPLLISVIAALAGIAASFPITGDLQAADALRLLVRTAVMGLLYLLLGSLLLKRQSREAFQAWTVLSAKFFHRARPSPATPAGTLS